MFQSKGVFNYHHGFGTWLRNHWGLWNGLRLAKYLNSVGIHHSDDMSATILDAYWSKLHGESIDLAKEAARCKEYWDKLLPVVDVAVNLPTTILGTELQITGGKTTSILTITEKGIVTVLALCGTSDGLSPQLIETLEELRTAYPTTEVNLIAVTAAGETSGAVTTTGKTINGKMVNTRSVSQVLAVRPHQQPELDITLTPAS